MKTAKGRGPLASGYWLGPYFSAESSMALATAFSASAMIGGTSSSGKLSVAATATALRKSVANLTPSRYPSSKSVTGKPLGRAPGGQPDNAYLRAMLRITITPAAYEAIAATLPSNMGVEQNRAPNGDYFIWLDPKYVDRLRALRGPGESYSDVIMRQAS